MSEVFIIRSMNDEPGKCVASSPRTVAHADCPNPATTVLYLGRYPVFAVCRPHADRIVAEWPQYTAVPLALEPFGIDHDGRVRRELSGPATTGSKE